MRDVRAKHACKLSLRLSGGGEVRVIVDEVNGLNVVARLLLLLLLLLLLSQRAEHPRHLRAGFEADRLAWARADRSAVLLLRAVKMRPAFVF